jgi:hypothetical protein
MPMGSVIKFWVAVRKTVLARSRLQRPGDQRRIAKQSDLCRFEPERGRAGIFDGVHGSARRHGMDRQAEGGAEESGGGTVSGILGNGGGETHRLRRSRLAVRPMEPRLLCGLAGAGNSVERAGRDLTAAWSGSLGGDGNVRPGGRVCQWSSAIGPSSGGGNFGVLQRPERRFRFNRCWRVVTSARN